MTGTTGLYSEQVLRLPDEENGNAPYSNPKLVYFPSTGFFQLQGISIRGFTSISKRQARQIVKFINQTLGDEEE